MFASLGVCEMNRRVRRKCARGGQKFDLNFQTFSQRSVIHSLKRNHRLGFFICENTVYLGLLPMLRSLFHCGFLKFLHRGMGCFFCCFHARENHRSQINLVYQPITALSKLEISRCLSLLVAIIGSPCSPL